MRILRLLVPLLFVHFILSSHVISQIANERPNLNWRLMSVVPHDERTFFMFHRYLGSGHEESFVAFADLDFAQKSQPESISLQKVPFDAFDLVLDIDSRDRSRMYAFGVKAGKTILASYQNGEETSKEINLLGPDMENYAGMRVTRDFLIAFDSDQAIIFDRADRPIGEAGLKVDSGLVPAFYWRCRSFVQWKGKIFMGLNQGEFGGGVYEIEIGKNPKRIGTEVNPPVDTVPFFWDRRLKEPPVVNLFARDSELVGFCSLGHMGTYYYSVMKFNEMNTELLSGAYTEAGFGSHESIGHAYQAPLGGERVFDIFPLKGQRELTCAMLVHLQGLFLGPPHQPKLELAIEAPEPGSRIHQQGNWLIFKVFDEMYIYNIVTKAHKGIPLLGIADN